MIEREDYADVGTIDHADLPRQAGPCALTDLGNAEYFVRLYRGQVRFDHRRNRWLLWREHRWVPDADAEIRRMAAEAMRRRLRDAADLDDPTIRQNAVKWALGSQTQSRITSLLWFAQADRAVADRGDAWDLKPLLLGCPNGVVDMRNGRLRDGDQADGITMSTAVEYHPEATCPRWTQFIAEVFAGDIEMMTFVQRAIGYSLTGITTEQVLFMPYGTGANGKGTLTNTIKRVAGDYGYNMPFATVEMRDRSAIPNDIAALLNRRFVAASETNDGTRLNEARIKALTGCDPMTARFLHGEFFEFQPVAKFWLSVNHKPIVRDDSYGFWRRIRLIPFTQTFAVDKTLDAALAAEFPGILRWIVDGAVAWGRDGLNPPAAVLSATDEYRQDSDVLGDFIREACELEPNARVGAADLFHHYKSWAERQGMSDRERMSQTMFGRKVSERFKSEKPGSVRQYVGLARRVL